MTPSAPHSHRYIRGASQQQRPHKSNSSGRVKPLMPLLARRKRMTFLMSSPVSGSYRCVRLAILRYTQSYATPAVLWSSPQEFAFQQKPWSLHLSMPHRQFMPCDWCPSIYNLWARASQRRALSKRINSPPPNRCIFNRDQSTQNKIQCQTHTPFTSPFWVWTKPTSDQYPRNNST